jgi:hypothetical protein
MKLTNKKTSVKTEVLIFIKRLKIMRLALQIRKICCLLSF